MTQKTKTLNRWWDFLVVLMLVVIITSAITRLIATEWTEGLNITRVIAYSGLIAGLALGYSVFSTRTVVFFTFVYGVFVILWQLGQILGEGILWTERLLSLAGRVGIITTELLIIQILKFCSNFFSFYTLYFIKYKWPNIISSKSNPGTFSQTVHPIFESLLPSVLRNFLQWSWSLR